MPLQPNDIESELSYAYLHAVASKAGLSCKVENRHGDNYGVDAQIDYRAPIENSYRTDVSLRIQLKATFNKGAETDTHIAYSFKGIEPYDRMRKEKGEPHRILVVLFLHSEQEDWLRVTHEELVLKNAAYWVCLYGAEETDNMVSKTIYLPKANLLTPESIVTLCQDIGRGNIPKYNVL